MSEDIPILIDAMRLARQGCSLQGSLKPSSMPRLSEMLTDDGEDIRVELELDVDAQNIPYMKGNISAKLALTCQRCLETMQYSLETSFLLGLVSNEQKAEELPGEYDPLVIGDEPSRVSEIIEDEILLALPVVAMHPEEECPATKYLQENNLNPDVQPEQKENPFAALGDLMKQDEN